MAFNVALEVSAESPWNGRSTPTIRVLLLLLPLPPDLLHAAVPATRVTAATASAVMRLVMLVLSVIDRVMSAPSRTTFPDPPADAPVSGLASSPTSPAGGPPRQREATIPPSMARA